MRTALEKKYFIVFDGKNVHIWSFQYSQENKDIASIEKKRSEFMGGNDARCSHSLAHVVHRNEIVRCTA